MTTVVHRSCPNTTSLFAILETDGCCAVTKGKGDLRMYIDPKASKARARVWVYVYHNCH